MKLRCLPALALLALPLVPLAPAATTDADEAAHAALRQLKATYEQAIRTGELTPLRALFTPETSAVMILGHEVKSFAELEQHWKFVRELIGPGGSYATTLNPERSLIYGDIAVARGDSAEIVRTGSGQEYRFTSRWTAVCRRVGPDWKVVRLHGSMDPVTNVFTTTFLSRAKWLYGGGGALVGGLLGVAAVLFFQRRSARA